MARGGVHSVSSSKFLLEEWIHCRSPVTRNKNKPIHLSKFSEYPGFLLQEMFGQCGLEISPVQQALAAKQYFKNIFMETFVIVVSVVEQYRLFIFIYLFFWVRQS